MQYTVVIPVFKRSEILKYCLKSINEQYLKPEEIIIVDNNVKEKESIKLKNILNKFIDNSNLKIRILKSYKNSSSIARNIGAINSKTELVAFLDSDVILEKNYYQIIINYFVDYSELIAIQGVDMAMLESAEKFKNKNLFFKLLHYFEQVFETSTLLNRETAYVSPSLAVAHPNLDKDFEIKSQWISTCAGVFKRYLFNNYNFPENFITYSNNEYLYFSYKLFKNNEGLMLYTSKAKYRDIQTNSGRLSFIPLLYQIEVNDLFIFLRMFDKTFLNVAIFIKSRFGHLIYNILKMIYNKRFNFSNLIHVIHATIYPFMHWQEVKKGDLTFYEKDFS